MVSAGDGAIGNLDAGLLARLVRLGVSVGPATDGDGRAVAPRSGLPWPIEEVVPGKWVTNEAGRCYVSVARRPIAEPHGAESLAAALEGGTDGLCAVARDRRLAQLDLGRAAFLDTETTGLAGGTGTYAFLIGIGRFDGAAFRVDQVFMSDPSEEGAQLRRAAEILGECDGVVTFNGRTFDVPLLATRYRLNGREFPLQGVPHMDLLPIARRLWRRRLPSCALTSLEQHVLGMHRRDDVPGWLIPTRYFDYQRDGDARPLGPVFAHNVLDVVSMVGIAARAARAYRSPHGFVDHGADWLSLARVYVANGRFRDAVEACDAAAAKAADLDAAEEALEWLGWSARRAGEWERAISAWCRMADVDAPRRLFPFEELAKYYEHHAPERDPARALGYVERGLALVASGALRPRRGTSRALAELEHRRQRLERKVASRPSPLTAC